MNSYYNYNNFFLIHYNDKPIYIHIIPACNEHKYNIELINNEQLYLFIKKKDNKKFNLKINIFKKNEETTLLINNQKLSSLKICNLNDLKYKKSQLNYFDIYDYFSKKFPIFKIDYYKFNNKYLNSILDKNFIYNHWLICGRYNANDYYKYLLYKYGMDILNLKTPIIKYSEKKNNTLLFIDDRYDPSFIFLLKLFLYSIDETWNIHIFTIVENKFFYENDMEKLNVNGKIHILENNFKNINDYSNFLKNSYLWSSLKEENCLLFQYDSFCMGKFDPIFFNYNYIGAQWDHYPSIIHKKMNIGNGGTSFRKTRIIEMLCNKYNNKSIKKDYPEDIFFCELLTENFLHNCTLEIANKFSFENIYHENSIYAHQIYKSIKNEDLDNFVQQKIKKMLEI
jgi:hypothetical protein